MARVGLESAWFGAGAIALLAAGHERLAIVFAALFLINFGLRRPWRH